MLDRLKRAIWNNFPRVYNLPEIWYIRWRDMEYTILKPHFDRWNR